MHNGSTCLTSSAASDMETWHPLSSQNASRWSPELSSHSNDDDDDDDERTVHCLASDAALICLYVRFSVYLHRCLCHSTSASVYLHFLVFVSVYICFGVSVNISLYMRSCVSFSMWLCRRASSCVLLLICLCMCASVSVSMCDCVCPCRCRCNRHHLSMRNRGTEEATKEMICMSASLPICPPVFCQSTSRCMHIYEPICVLSDCVNEQLCGRAVA